MKSTREFLKYVVPALMLVLSSNAFAAHRARHLGLNGLDMVGKDALPLLGAAVVAPPVPAGMHGLDVTPGGEAPVFPMIHAFAFEANGLDMVPSEDPRYAVNQSHRSGHAEKIRSARAELPN